MSTEETMGRKSIWDNSRDQYIRKDFKLYWETLPLVRAYQMKCMTGSEAVDMFSHTLGLVRERAGERNLRALSVGCIEGNPGPEMSVFGTGLFRAIDVMDIAEGLLDKQRKMAADRGLRGITYIRQDLNNVTLEEQAYDLIWAVGTVHHVENLESFFEQVNGALKPRGIFMMREYIGPDRIQFTPEQLAVANEIFSILPEKYRTDADGVVRKAVLAPDIGVLMQQDPSESVRSEDIMGVLKRKLAVIKLSHTGGTILHPLLAHIASNFEGNEDADTLLKLLIVFERTLIEKNVLPSDYVYCVAARKGSVYEAAAPPAEAGRAGVSVSQSDAAGGGKSPEIAGLQHELRTSQARLAAVEGQLNLILSSRGWRLLSRCFRLADRVLGK